MALNTSQHHQQQATSSTKPFEFFAGSSGAIDWPLLTAIDIQRVARETDTVVMQRVLQNLSFARLTPNEAAGFSPDHVVHLFTLTQLCSQYLIYCQGVLEANLDDARRDLLQESSKRVSRELELKDALEKQRQMKREMKEMAKTIQAYEKIKQQYEMREHARASGKLGHPAVTSTLFGGNIDPSFNHMNMNGGMMPQQQQQQQNAFFAAQNPMYSMQQQQQAAPSQQFTQMQNEIQSLRRTVEDMTRAMSTERELSQRAVQNAQVFNAMAGARTVYNNSNNIPPPSTAMPEPPAAAATPPIMIDHNAAEQWRRAMHQHHGTVIGTPEKISANEAAYATGDSRVEKLESTIRDLMALVTRQMATGSSGLPPPAPGTLQPVAGSAVMATTLNSSGHLAANRNNNSISNSSNAPFSDAHMAMARPPLPTGSTGTTAAESFWAPQPLPAAAPVPSAPVVEPPALLSDRYPFHSAEPAYKTAEFVAPDKVQHIAQQPAAVQIPSAPTPQTSPDLQHQMLGASQTLLPPPLAAAASVDAPVAVNPSPPPAVAAPIAATAFDVSAPAAAPALPIATVASGPAPSLLADHQPVAAGGGDAGGNTNFFSGATADLGSHPFGGAAGFGSLSSAASDITGAAVVASAPAPAPAPAAAEPVAATGFPDANYSAPPPPAAAAGGGGTPAAPATPAGFALCGAAESNTNPFFGLGGGSVTPPDVPMAAAAGGAAAPEPSSNLIATTAAPPADGASSSAALFSAPPVAAEAPSTPLVPLAATDSLSAGDVLNAAAPLAPPLLGGAPTAATPEQPPIAAGAAGALAGAVAQPPPTQDPTARAFDTAAAGSVTALPTSEQRVVGQTADGPNAMIGTDRTGELPGLGGAVNAAAAAAPAAAATGVSGAIEAPVTLSGLNTAADSSASSSVGVPISGVVASASFSQPQLQPQSSQQIQYGSSSSNIVGGSGVVGGGSMMMPMVDYHHQQQQHLMAAAAGGMGTPQHSASGGGYMPQQPSGFFSSGYPTQQQQPPQQPAMNWVMMPDGSMRQVPVVAAPSPSPAGGIFASTPSPQNPHQHQHQQHHHHHHHHQMPFHPGGVGAGMGTPVTSTMMGHHMQMQMQPSGIVMQPSSNFSLPAPQQQLPQQPAAAAPASSVVTTDSKDKGRRDRDSRDKERSSKRSSRRRDNSSSSSASSSSNSSSDSYGRKRRSKDRKKSSKSKRDKY